MTEVFARLGEVCEINPRLPRNHGLTDDTAVSFVPMAAVSEVSGTVESASVRRFAEVKKGYTPFADGDVLFAKITPCMENGKAALATKLAGGRGFGSTEFHVLRAGEKVLPEWIHYFVRRSPFRLEAKRNFTGTAGQQRVPASFLERTVIPVPPLPEQRRIVDLLARAEGILRLRREAQQKTAELIPALFIEMFGDPAANPKGWAVRRLADLLAMPMRNGISPSRSGQHAASVLTLSAITRGKFDQSAVKEAMFANPIAESDEVRATDFLICRGNGNKSLVGVGSFPHRDMPGVAFPDTVIAVRPDPVILAPSFLAALWGTSFVRQQIEMIAKTTNGTFKINQAGLAGIKLTVPPTTDQAQFAFSAAAVESISRQQTTAAGSAEATFAALLQKAFA